MKSLNCAILALAFLLTAGQQAWAEKMLLTSEQLKEQFTEKSMTVTNARPDDKMGGQDEPFRVFLSGMGVTRTQGDDDRDQARMWYVSDDDRLCFSRPFHRRYRGNTCGQIVKDENGQYWMYQTKDIHIKSGSLVGMYKDDLLVMFSDFAEGNDVE